MFKNIGKRLRFLAALLAVLLFAGCLVMAVLFVIATVRATDPAMKSAGIEGACLFAVLALVLPLLTWVLYAFGMLVENSERQVEQTREIRELLKKALTDGALSDEIARKTGAAVAKAVPTAPAPRAGVAPSRPVLRETPRPVTPAPVAPVAPVAETPAEPTLAPAAPAPAPAPTPAQSTQIPPAPAAPAVPEAPAASVAPVAPTPFTADGNSALSPLRTFGSEETY